MNASVVLHLNKGQIVAKTDANIIQKLNPVTLEPLEAADYSLLNPLLNGPLCAAHGATFVDDAAAYNYVLELGAKPKYRIFSHKGYEKGEAKILTMRMRMRKKTRLYLTSQFMTTPMCFSCCSWKTCANSNLKAIRYSNTDVCIYH